MKLTQEISLSNTVVHKFGYTPRKRKGDPPKRKRRKPAIDKSSKITMELQTPLTRPFAELLGVAELLFEDNHPHGGYIRCTLDVDAIHTVKVKVADTDRNAHLEIQADTLKGFAVLEAKGSGPVLRWKMLASGYMSQLADFAAVIEDYAFTLVYGPVQAQLFDTSAAPKADKNNAQIYAV